MTEIVVAFPPEEQHWIDTRVEREGFGDASAYLRELVRRDQAWHDDEVRRVRALIAEGEASGIVDREPEDVLHDIMAGISARYG